MLLIDKNALVFGQGEIALGIATAYAREGAQVLLGWTGRSPPHLPAGVAVEMVDDATDRTALEELVRKKIPQIDVLATVSEPVSLPTRLEELSVEAYAATFAKTVSPVVTLMQLAMPIMRERGGGHIIVGGSVYGPNVDRYIGDYVSATSALQATVRSASAEWGKHQIICNMLVAVALTAEYIAYAHRYPEESAMLLQQLPLRRMGDPVADIGGAALYLACEDSCYVTGQTIYADGGQSLTGAVLEPTHDRARAHAA